MPITPITPADIIEAIIDELAMGDLGESVDAFNMTRLGPGELELDYGNSGMFRLTVAEHAR